MTNALEQFGGSAYAGHSPEFLEKYKDAPFSQLLDDAIYALDAATESNVTDEDYERTAQEYTGYIGSYLQDLIRRCAQGDKTITAHVRKGTEPVLWSVQSEIYIRRTAANPGEEGIFFEGVVRHDTNAFRPLWTNLTIETKDDQNRLTSRYEFRSFRLRGKDVLVYDLIRSKKRYLNQEEFSPKSTESRHLTWEIHD